MTALSCDADAEGNVMVLSGRGDVEGVQQRLTALLTDLQVLGKSCAQVPERSPLTAVQMQEKAKEAHAFIRSA